MPEAETSQPLNSRSETPAATPAPVRSCKLLGLHGALRIDHKGAIYTLRATSKGGLILTK